MGAFSCASLAGLCCNSLELQGQMSVTLSLGWGRGWGQVRNRALPNYPALGLRKIEAFQREPIGSRESQHESPAHLKRKKKSCRQLIWIEGAGTLEGQGQEKGQGLW